jgi:HK97 family phage major capsid protein
MAKLVEVRAQVEALKAEIRAFAEKEELTEEEETRFTAAITEGETAVASLTELEARARKVAEIASKTTDKVAGEHVAPGQINSKSPFDVDIRSASAAEMRDAGMRVLESRGKRLSAKQSDTVDRLLRGESGVRPRALAERAILTESEAYRSAYAKTLGSTNPRFTAEEGAAVDAVKASSMERRAANEGTPSAGGYAVPITIDPTIILTSGARDVPILSVMKVVQVETDAYRGVTSMGMTFTYGAEASAVADGTPVLTQPVIPVYRATGFVPFSYEIDQDIPGGFADEIAATLAQGYVNLLAQGTMTGSGTNCPRGIYTALTGVTGSQVLVSTLGTLGAIDVRAAWSSLPELFRQRATWLMNTSVENVIRAFGNGPAGSSQNLALADFTIDLTAPGESRLVGRPIILSDYSPAFTGTTGTSAQLAILGDFSHFVLVQRVGMSTELIPNLFDTSTGRPTGQRGILSFSRHGYDVDSPLPFRILSNNAV